jgi:hypothetical protein
LISNPPYTLTSPEPVELPQRVELKGRANGGRKTNVQTTQTIREEGHVGMVTILII